MNCEHCGIMLGGCGDSDYAECPRYFDHPHNRNTCNGFFHPDCLIKHDTEVHIGPKERAVLEQWQQQARNR